MAFGSICFEVPLKLYVMKAINVFQSGVSRIWIFSDL